MSAFTSPNIHPLGVMGVEFEMRWDLIQRHTNDGRMTIFTKMSNDISLVSVSPLLNNKVFESILS